MKLVYVAGPFRSRPNPADQWMQWANIRRAAALALEVWRAGASCICPHLNTCFFEGSLPAEVWLYGDIEQLRRCDAVIMTPDWERSDGAKAEHEFARRNQIKIFYDVKALREWLYVEDHSYQAAPHV